MHLANSYGRIIYVSDHSLEILIQQVMKLNNTFFFNLTKTSNSFRIAAWLKGKCAFEKFRSDRLKLFHFFSLFFLTQVLLLPNNKKIKEPKKGKSKCYILKIKFS
jgi:hypothetical protein